MQLAYMNTKRTLPGGCCFSRSTETGRGLTAGTSSLLWSHQQARITWCRDGHKLNGVRVCPGTHVWGVGGFVGDEKGRVELKDFKGRE